CTTRGLVASAAMIAAPGGAISFARDDDQRQKERELVRAAQAGNVAAFERLYRENVKRVYALCYRMSGGAQLAEELTQDVFVRAWQKLAGFRGDSAFSSWLHPIAINVAYSERRSRGRREARVSTHDDLTPFEAEANPRRPHDALGVDLARARCSCCTTWRASSTRRSRSIAASRSARPRPSCIARDGCCGRRCSDEVRRRPDPDR